jgi:DNA topoisomerase I
MSKFIINTVSVVIVESPAKCKKIESYLGPGYKVVASFGHLRNLDGLNAIDIEHGFKPKYSIIQEDLKLKQIEKLRSLIATADDVILATDDDREGEAIAWHICELFGLSVETTKRIIFHEITEKALQSAVAHPKRINMNIVHAQQSRQILDVLVGFTITPYLWKCVSKNHKNSLSAGRCQTPALRLVYDNYLEIHKSPGKIVYNTSGYFTNMNLQFDLNTQFEEKEHALQFLTHCKTADFSCSTTSPKKSIRKAPEPLTTSLLQQLASNELHLSPKETMKHAQQLYEGGYITYMRTDSNKYSKEFIDQVKEYITHTYGETYCSQSIYTLIVGTNKTEETDNLDNPDKTDKSNKKCKTVAEEKGIPKPQEAHEAIRPVSINVKIPNTEDISDKAKRLYDLIWKRTLESCMSSAQFNIITAKIMIKPSIMTHDNNKKECEFTYKAEQIGFAGWQIVENVTKEPLNESNKNPYQYFSSMKQNIIMKPKKILSKFTLNELKSHYTEARLVQLLEEKGIGRPSTFATLIDKIQERSYVSKKNITGKEIECEDYALDEKCELTTSITKREFGNEKNKLVIEPLGIIVIEFLLSHFDNFFNYDYTKDMENALDLISNGNKTWTSLCDECNKELIYITKDLKDEKKFSLKLDETHTLIIGKYGPVIKQVKNGQPATFLPVKKDLDINALQNSMDQNMPQLKIEDIIDTTTKNKDAIGKYKGEDLFIKKGKYGVYAKWGNESVSLKELDGKSLDSIEYIEVLRILERDNVLDSQKPVGFVRELSSTLSIRTGKFGDYIFYKKPRVKQPQFLKLKEFNGDARKCEKELLLNWIKLTYKVE